MNPIFSEEERRIAVKNFIIGRYHGTVKISNYEPMLPYLDEGRVKLLLNMTKKRDTYGYTRYFLKDAKNYFEYLIATVTGAYKVPEDIVKQANDQLFIFIHALRDVTEIHNTVTLLRSHNWEKKFEQFSEKLDELLNNVESRDEKITYLFTKILEWMKEYRPLLDEVQKDYDDKIGKAFNNEGHKQET